MAWSCRSHSPPWSQIGQSSGWLISRNSSTPSRAFLTIGVRVLMTGGSPLGPGRQSRTPQAQLATGFGEPLTSTRHMRQLPAIDSRSWKQKRGISAPAASHACKSVNSAGTSTSLPSMTSLVIPLRPRSGAARRLPHLCGRQTLPIERMPGRAVLFQMLEPRHRLVDRGPMSCRHPPHHEIPITRWFEPFRAPRIEAFVYGLPDVALQRFDAFPHRHVDGDPRIAVRAKVRGIPGVVLQPPNETFGAVCDRVHPREIVDEIRHSRIADLVAQASDIELRQMLPAHFVAPFPWVDTGSSFFYSAAIAAGSAAGRAAYSSILRSISCRKWRINPW